MSKKQFYLDVKLLLETGATSIKDIALWNNQWGVEQNEREEIPRPLPGAYLEWIDFDWRNNKLGLQEGDIQFTIKCVFQRLATDPIDYLDIVDEVYAALHQKTTTVSGPISRISEEQDVDHGRVIIWGITFATNLVDCSADQRGNYVDTNVTGIEVQGALDIDNPVIRTGDGKDVTSTGNP